MDENIEYSEFDKEDFVEKEIKPIIQELKKKCLINGVPFCTSFAYKNMKTNKKNPRNNTGGETEYYNDGLLPYPENIKLYEDYFDNYLLAIRGGQFVNHIMAENLFSGDAENLSGLDEMTRAVLQEEDEDNFGSALNESSKTSISDIHLSQIQESYDSKSKDMEDAEEIVVTKKTVEIITEAKKENSLIIDDIF